MISAVIEPDFKLPRDSQGRINPHFDLDDYDPEADLMIMNLGPQHPSTHGVFRIKLAMDGERIVKAVAYPGYLHRGVEKLMEKLTLAQVTPIVDKNDYVSPMINEQAINMAMEALLGVEVPRRARYLRSLLAEMQRIASHLVAVGTFTIDLGGAIGGGTTLFMWCFRERDMILDRFEELTGSRFHYNTHFAGGNRHDVPAGWDKTVRETLASIEARLDEYESFATTNRIFLERTRGVGVLSRSLALELGIGGPNGRASGVDHDLRRDAPYSAYNEVKVNVPVMTTGDCYARASLRILEMRESIRLARLFLDGLPEGPISATKPIAGPASVRIPKGQVYVGVEGPRGELGTYLIAGGERGTAAYRLKIRPPSLHSLAAIPYLLPGNLLSDVIAILGSLDPIMGEVDR